MYNIISVAEKMAIQSLISQISSLSLANENKLLSDEELNKLIFNSVGDVKPEYFDIYSEEYDFYFELLNNKQYESTST